MVHHATSPAPRLSVALEPNNNQKQMKRLGKLKNAAKKVPMFQLYAMGHERSDPFRDNGAVLVTYVNLPLLETTGLCWLRTVILHLFGDNGAVLVTYGNLPLLETTGPCWLLR